MSVPNPPARRRGFRPEVQALRAVAVGGVVLYHLWPAAVPGGFVGVDVFFVISGFLITGLLADELAETGRIRLLAFWARRIRRILPAAFVVLGVSLLLLVTAMPRLTWADNLGDIRAAAAYVINWVLGSRAVDYLAAEKSPSLVQHYWSLSVEEQFYLVWPLLLLVPVAATRWLHRGRRQAWVVLVLLVAFVASLVTSIGWTHADPAVAFFATPTRAWEFAAGGLVATAGLDISRRWSASMRAAASWVGLAVIAMSMFTITGDDAFPGWIAAIPVAGAVLVIAAETSTVRWTPVRLMAVPPMQWVGDNSYSIYLWHWPLIVVAPWLLHRSTPMAGKLLILALSLLLAAATKRWVEDPLRTGALWRARTWPAYSFAVSGVVVLALVSTSFSGDERHAEQVAKVRQQAVARSATEAQLVTHHRSCFGAAAMLPVNVCPHPFARPRHLDPSLAETDGTTDPCLEQYDAATPRYCVRGDTSHPRRTIALVGNSHAWRLIPALSLYGEHHGWKIVTATRVNCLGLITSAISSRGATSNCLAWTVAVQRHLLAMPHLDAVLFAGYRFADEFVEGANPSPSELATARHRVLQTWSTYARHGIRVIVTGDVPGMRPALGPACIAQSSSRNDPCAVSRAAAVHPNLTSLLAAAHPDLAHYVSLTRYFCDATKCHALIGGVVVYFDSHHITTTFSQSLAAYLGADVTRALGARVAVTG